MSSSGSVAVTRTGDARCAIASTPLTASSNAPGCSDYTLETSSQWDEPTGTYQSDVFDNRELEAVSVGCKDLLNGCGLLSRTDSPSHRKSLSEELLGNPAGDETVHPSDEDLSRLDGGHWRASEFRGLGYAGG